MSDSDRLNCVLKLHEMGLAYENIKMQWDNRHYSANKVIEKIERLQENISDFNHFYLKYIDRTEKDERDYKAFAEILGGK